MGARRGHLLGARDPEPLSYVVRPDGFARHVVEHRRGPSGIAWLLLGGSRDDLGDWIGPAIDDLPLGFNGGAAGLRAVAVNTDGGQIVVRRRPVSLAGAPPLEA
jgi:hypothetical protein